MPLSDAYGALHESAAYVEVSGRGRIRLTGEDRARLLHAMTTNHVLEMKPGEGRYAFFLNAQGRILADVHIFCFENHFLLDTEPEVREKIYQHLDHYIIADDVTLEDVTDSLAAISIEGPKAKEVLSNARAPDPAGELSTGVWGSIVLANMSLTGAGGTMLLMPPAEKDETIARFALPLATADDARVTRIENGIPRYGEDITERYLVQETGQMNAVHFTKGCYLGQEIVERVRSRAQIHRILRRLEIDAQEPPAPGTKLKAGEMDAGEIATAVYSPVKGKVVAMAYVRIPYAEAGSELKSGDALVRVL